MASSTVCSSSAGDGDDIGKNNLRSKKCWKMGVLEELQEDGESGWVVVGRVPCLVVCSAKEPSSLSIIHKGGRK